MSTATKSPRKPASVSTQSDEPKMLPISGEIPATAYAKVRAAAIAGERTLAGQLRVIVKQWADAQPAS